MTEQFDHYISKSIRNYYKTRILFPIIYIALLIVVAIVYPVTSLVLPRHVDSDCHLADQYNAKERYVQISLDNLYFTGYTKKWLDQTSGYYYYTSIGEECVVVLLAPETCQQGLPTIEHLTVRAKILYHSYSVDKLYENLARDLSWSESGIKSTISPYMLSQPDAIDYRSIFFLVVYFFTGFYALCSIVIYLIYILFPVLSTPCQRLRYYGKPKEILAQAEEELATLPQLATEDMFITEHFFIETSNFGVAIVPISEIVWIYKYSTLHKFLWHHFSISYTLHITAKKRRYIHCPKNIKSDIDGIMDYLAEANHNILVGFSEENRLKVEEIQGDMEVLKKFWKFLSKKV